MNVFEFLGLPSNHRPKNKVVQLVKHYSEVNPNHEEGSLHKKVKFPMWAQCKRDGVFAMLVVTMDCRVGIFGRTGERLSSTEDLVSFYGNLTEVGLLPPGVYFSELVSDNPCSLEQLSGVVNPNRKKPLEGFQQLIRESMYLAFFDRVEVEEFTEGSSDIIFYERFLYLASELPATECLLDIDVVHDEAELMNYANKLINLGHEGAVFKQDVGWLAGAKDWHQMKVVRRYEVDLECIGWEEGTGKYTGLVANLLFRYKGGKVVKAMLGKGWTHEAAREMYNEINGLCGTQPKHNPIGSIFRVYGLQPSSKNGVIRLPKVGDQRFDKTEPDF